MASTAASPEALRTLRQRGSVVLGVISIVGGVGLAFWSLVSGEPSLVFIGSMLLVAACGWTLFVRPALVITLVGVHVHNPLRRTVVPWDKVDDLATRWNLEVYTGEKRIPVWAIASHIERPRGAGLLGATGLGRKMMADSVPVPKGATVQTSAASIELAREEWAEMVADGRPEVVAVGEVSRRWDALDIAALVVPVVLVVLGLLL